VPYSATRRLDVRYDGICREQPSHQLTSSYTQVLGDKQNRQQNYHLADIELQPHKARMHLQHQEGPQMCCREVRWKPTARVPSAAAHLL
jgi:hypothetical protein